jgi:hypothetical protein
VNLPRVDQNKDGSESLIPKLTMELEDVRRSNCGYFLEIGQGIVLKAENAIKIQTIKGAL